MDMNVVSVVVPQFIMIIGIILFAIGVSYVLKSLGYMKCMEKAGESKWKAWVPLYSTYTMYKISGLSGLCIIVDIIKYVISVATIVIVIGVFAEIINDAEKFDKQYSYNTRYSTSSRYQDTDSLTVYPTQSTKQQNEKMENVADALIVFSGISRLVSLAGLVVSILFAIKITKAFNLSTGYGFAVFFFPTITMLIIGFGDSVYVGDKVN